MKTKRILACLLASVMACGAFTACGDKEEESSSSSESSVSESSEDSSEDSSDESSESSEEDSAPAEDSASESEASKAPVAVETPEFEEAVVAESGDAYLAIVDSQWWVQYWGEIDSLLTYDAGVVPITGNGDYTVSVTADTNGFRYDATGDANGEYTPGGLEFLAVMIKDGESLFPGAVITVNSVKVDGTEVAMSSKAYTSTDDGIETRANIFNKWCNGVPSKDARTVDGNLYDDNGNALPACADYAPEVVSIDDFTEWTTVEVDFTVSGIAE